MENAPMISDDKGLVVYREPRVVLEEARKAAEALTEVIKAKPDKVEINGRQYLEFEDWQTLGRFYGLTVKVDSTAALNIDGIRGWEAKASVLNRNGDVIGSAEAMCLNDEEKWSAKPKYEYHYVLKDGTTMVEDPPKDQIVWIKNPKKPGKSMPKKERVRLADQPVPSFQLRSMAQTRACAKAFRNVLAWVVVLAGYKPTPIEEMDGVYEAETTHTNGHNEPPPDDTAQDQGPPTEEEAAQELKDRGMLPGGENDLKAQIEAITVASEVLKFMSAYRKNHPKEDFGPITKLVNAHLEKLTKK